MKNAAQLREQIEITLSSRVPSALTPIVKPRPEQTSCGISTIDELLQGGLTTGVLTELVGSLSSGGTTMALTYVATTTQAGGVCAWIDAADVLGPESAAAVGIDLEKLLWVRCGIGSQQTNKCIPETQSNSYRPTAGDLKSCNIGGSSPHPLLEYNDTPEAISALMRAHGGPCNKQIRRENKAVGTPSMPNRSLTGQSKEREEQINNDRLPPRRGNNLLMAPRCAEPQSRRVMNLPIGRPLSLAETPRAASEKRWQALDQALRVTDLLLQGGGFGVVVLDLGSTPPEFVWRIPSATWFRFRAACERTRISLVLLTKHPCAGTSAELVVRLQTGVLEAENGVMTGIHYQAAVERSRSNEFKPHVVPIRKPPQHAGQWKSEAVWARSK